MKIRFRKSQLFQYGRGPLHLNRRLPSNFHLNVSMPTIPGEATDDERDDDEGASVDTFYVHIMVTSSLLRLSHVILQHWTKCGLTCHLCTAYRQ